MDPRTQSKMGLSGANELNGMGNLATARRQADALVKVTGVLVLKFGELGGFVRAGPRKRLSRRKRAGDGEICVKEAWLLCLPITAFSLIGCKVASEEREVKKSRMFGSTSSILCLSARRHGLLLRWHCLPFS